jgi:hypothetical protein
VRNVGTCVPDVKGEIQVGGPHKGERTEAGHRDGVTRSSGEGSVMELERRGDSVWLGLEVNPRGEESGGTSKTVQYFQTRGLGGV